MNDPVTMMINARFTTHSMLCNQGYTLHKDKHYESLDTLMKAYGELDVKDVENMIGIYTRRNHDGSASKTVVYPTFNAFNKVHITLFLQRLIDEQAEFIVICWVRPKPSDIPLISFFNDDRRVEIYQVEDIQSNLSKHFHSPDYELIPICDEEEILSDLRIKKENLPKVYTFDPLIRALGLTNHEKRMIRVVNGGSINYSLIVNGKSTKKETRFI